MTQRYQLARVVPPSDAAYAQAKDDVAAKERAAQFLNDNEPSGTYLLINDGEVVAEFEARNDRHVTEILLRVDLP